MTLTMGGASHRLTPHGGGFERRRLHAGPHAVDVPELGAQAWRLLRDTVGEPPANNGVVWRNYARMGPLRYLRTARYMLADRLEETILRCDLPVLVIRGERDPSAPHHWARQLVRLAPNAGLLEIPDGPHAVQFNRPRDLAAACAPFLESLPR